MDFGFTSEQEDIRSLAEKLFGDFCKTERLPDFEKASERLDRELWKALADAGLLGVALPEEFGGMGFGIAELAILLEQAGRFVAPIPLFPTLVLGAAPIAEFGSDAQKKRWLGEVVTGKTILTAALVESDTRDASRPTTTANADGTAWTLDGVKICVPAAHLASRIVVPATTADGSIIMALVSPEADGVTLDAQETTSGDLFYRVTLAGVKVATDDLLAGPDRGAAVLAWLLERSIAGLCAMELGIAERALRMTAKYTAERKQFGKVIATFQAVAQRAADAYIDVEAVRLTTWQAIWRLAEGLPATRELSIAKFWASEGGHRACYAAQHLHGGIGVDKDYPLHRYYLLSKQIELTLGGAHEHLARIGAQLAAGRMPA
ncbi:MAG TPA: acyl-CoA dehydrogenase family protein [Candidatus Limnocylindrales bacterium]|nr:acyl-CoA dehydrogenase family protein [Candidatus Limnocylindrales bacterium]